MVFPVEYAFEPEGVVGFRWSAPLPYLDPPGYPKFPDPIHDSPFSSHLFPERDGMQKHRDAHCRAPGYQMWLRRIVGGSSFSYHMTACPHPRLYPFPEASRTLWCVKVDPCMGLSSAGRGSLLSSALISRGFPLTTRGFGAATLSGGAGDRSAFPDRAPCTSSHSD